MSQVFTRVLYYTYEEEENPDSLELFDPKYNKRVTIPRDHSTTPDFTAMNWLQKKNISVLGCMMNHITCEFEGAMPDLFDYNVPISHVLEISTVKNDAGVYQLKIHSARYSQSVYVDIKDGRDTITNAYEWLDEKGYTLVSADVDSLKMYVVSDIMKPLYNTPELV